MYMIDPRYMCTEHIFDEHRFIHLIRPRFDKKRRIANLIGLIAMVEPLRMAERHEALVVEMTRRGYKHDSPYVMPDIGYLNSYERSARVNKYASIQKLMQCPKCRSLIGTSQERLYK